MSNAEQKRNLKFRENSKMHQNQQLQHHQGYGVFQKVAEVRYLDF